VGSPTAFSSRLIPQANHATAQGLSQLLNVTLETYRQTTFQQIHFTTPYGSGQSGVGTSVTPTWRFSLWQVMLVNKWATNATLTEKEAAYAGISAAMDLYRNITPESGAYMVRMHGSMKFVARTYHFVDLWQNEADIHEPN
jgi:hypothetical protein